MRGWPEIDHETDVGTLWLKWVVRLRWVAIVAQIVMLAIALPLLDSVWLAAGLVVVVVVLAAGNARALAVLAEREEVDDEVLFWQLALDVTALTCFFLFAGGTSNPFAQLYLIHVAMGAMMLRGMAAGMLTAFVFLSYVFVSLVHYPLHYEAHALSEATVRVVGHFSAFLVTSLSIAGFVVGLSTALRGREAQLLQARDRTARTDRLRTVGTMAAGAAHELNTPLSTIGLRLRRVARRHQDDDTQSDVQAARGQLERCSSIVERLLVGAGDPSASALARRPLHALVDEAVYLWRQGTTLGVVVDDQSEGVEIEVPVVAFAQALVNLLENAREAQEEIGRDDPLELTLRATDDRAMLLVRDHGPGLKIADQVGEPFFTTKVHGTGLGVFVARAVADGAGGGLSYRSSPAGTEARWWFPLARRPV